MRRRRLRAPAVLGLLGLLAGTSASPALAEPVPAIGTAPSAGVRVLEDSTSGSAGVRQAEYWLGDYGFTTAWKSATGQGVTVAVIDTGVDGTHPDLVGNVLTGSDVSGGGAANGWKGLGAEPEHGTLVASMIAAHGHGSVSSTGPGRTQGMIGVAPEARILPISLWLGTTNPGGVSVDEQIPRAVRRAVDEGAKVINLSVGSDSTSWPQSWDDAFAYAQSHDVVVVASAGNRGSGVTQVGAPATIPGVVAVGGVDRARKASELSSSQGISIAVSAPSEDLMGAMPGDQYGIWSGTSGSAPIVSGLVALLRQTYPQESAAQIIQRLVSTAQDVGAKGRDPLYGFGIIDPVAALTRQEDVSGVSENPLGSVAQWAAVHRRSTAAPEEQEEATEAAEPEHQAGESIAPVAAPRPIHVQDLSWLAPGGLVAAFALWTGLLCHWTLRRLHAGPPERRSAAVAARDSRHRRPARRPRPAARPGSSRGPGPRS